MVSLRDWLRGRVSVKKHSSPMFSGVDGRALDAALLHRRKLRDPLFRALLRARSMRSVLAVSDTTENRSSVLLVLQ